MVQSQDKYSLTKKLLIGNRILILTLLAVSIIEACTEREMIRVPESDKVAFNVNAIVPNETKTYYDEQTETLSWCKHDKVGIIAICSNGNATDSFVQPFHIENAGLNDYVREGVFTGKLSNVSSDEYTIFGVYPYMAYCPSDFQRMKGSLYEYQFPEIDGWDPSVDFMYSEPSSVASLEDEVTLKFHRLFGILSLHFSESLLAEYGKERVETISIKANEPICGDFELDLSQEEKIPIFASDSFNEITLDYRGKEARLSEIIGCFIIKPGVYSSLKITIQTVDHILVFERENLGIKKSTITSANLSLRNSDIVLENNEIMLPRNPQKLNVLTFGHSYAMNALSLLPGLVKTQGMALSKKVTFAYFYASNCSLQSYWGKTTSPNNVPGGSETTMYSKFTGGEANYTTSNKTVIDALMDEDWDVIIFQHRVESLGKYETFNPALDNLIDYVNSKCEELYGHKPVIGWHMFWTDPYTQERDYAAHVQAAKKLMRNENIHLFVPTGTAIQLLRNSSINNEYYFTRDYGHLDAGAGCYAASCTWFETFIKPCFGITVNGNPYIPSDYNHMQVTLDNYRLLQKAAIYAAKHKFDITDIETVKDAELIDAITVLN